MIFLLFILSTSAIAQEYIGADHATFQMDLSLKAEPRSLGLILPKNWREGQTKLPAKMGAMATLPEKFSWKDQLPPVRDQGSCGSCWAFSMTGVLESVVSLHGGGVQDLSEQYLVSCDRKNSGCSGGWMEYHVYKSAGAVGEADFPYKARDLSCPSGLKNVYQIRDWHYVSDADLPSAEELKRAIYTWGPLSVAVSVSGGFSSYRAGIYNEAASGSLNHAVVLVGWDDTVKPAHWIMRNSWGTNWGEGGYMRIAYTSRKIGSAATVIDYKGEVPHGPIPTPTPAPTPTPTPEPCPKCTLWQAILNLFGGN